MIENHNFNLNYFFSKQLENLKCDYDTRAYIVSIFEKFKSSSADYSKDSITLLYAEAKYKQDFYTFQSIADWIFFINALFPEHFNNASQDYYYSVGRLSYYSCYNLLNRQWKIYERLADDLVPLSFSTREIIRKY